MGLLGLGPTRSERGLGSGMSADPGSNSTPWARPFMGLVSSTPWSALPPLPHRSKSAGANLPALVDAGPGFGPFELAHVCVLVQTPPPRVVQMYFTSHL